MPSYAKSEARLPVRISAELLEDVRELARADGESVSSTVRRALRDAVRAARLERKCEDRAP